MVPTSSSAPTLPPAEAITTTSSSPTLRRPTPVSCCRSSARRTLPAERYEFPARFRPGFPFGEVVIGLTGKQAGDAKWRPIAWRVSVVDAKGKVLAAKHSFLWGTPRDLGR